MKLLSHGACRFPRLLDFIDASPHCTVSPCCKRNEYPASATSDGAGSPKLDGHPTGTATSADSCASGHRASSQKVDATGWRTGLALRGMKVSEAQQGHGLGRVFALVWILLCQKLRHVPMTKVMEKPLLCLLLQKLGFTPSSDRALVAEVSRPDSHRDGDGAATMPVMSLWSHDFLRLRNTVSKRKLSSLGMEIVAHRSEHGRQVYLHTAFTAPPMEELWPQVLAELDGHVKVYSAHVLALMSNNG